MTLLQRNEIGQRALTLGTRRAGLRITRGRLDRNGHWHPNQPCIILTRHGKGVPRAQ